MAEKARKSLETVQNYILRGGDINAKKKGEKSKWAEDGWPAPFRALVVAKTGGGKTHWVIERLLLAPGAEHNLARKSTAVVILAPGHSLRQGAYVRLLEVANDVQPKAKTFEVDEKFTSVQAEEIQKHIRANHDAGKKTLVIADDLVSLRSMPVASLIDALAVSGRHHGASLVCLAQRGFSPIFSRTLRMNTDFYVLGRLDPSEFRTLFAQIAPKSAVPELLAAWRDATSRRHGMLQFSPEMLLRSREGGLSEEERDLRRLLAVTREDMASSYPRAVAALVRAMES